MVRNNSYKNVSAYFHENDIGRRVKDFSFLMKLHKVFEVLKWFY